MLEAVSCLTERQVEVVGIVPAHGPLSPLLEASGATVVEQPNAWWATPGHPSRVRMARPAAVAGGRNLVALVPMIRLLRSVRPDVVVTNTLTVPLGAVAAKIAGLPHVWYRHEFGRNDPTLRFHFGDGLTFASIDVLSTRVIVNSRSVLEDFSGKRFRSKARLVRHAVMVPDISTPTPGDHGGPLRLVQVGRLAPSKGHEDAVRAAGELRRRGVEVALRFVGPLDLPIYTEKLLGLARKEAVEDRIAIEGFRPDPTGDVIWADVALDVLATGSIRADLGRGDEAGAASHRISGGRDQGADPRRVERLHLSARGRHGACVKDRTVRTGPLARGNPGGKREELGRGDFHGGALCVGADGGVPGGPCREEVRRPRRSSSAPSSRMKREFVTK